MNTEILLEQFDRISDAPDAVPRLRRFVLELAIRGKLVDQNPEDEPASELLRRLLNGKVAVLGRAEREGRSRRLEMDEHQMCQEMPRSWALTTLGSIALKITDGTHKTPTYVPSGVPFISVKDFSGGRLDLSNTRFITQEEHTLLYKRCDPKRGDILIGRIGTLGRAVLVDTDVEFSLFVSVGLIRFSHNFIVPEFIRLLLNSPFIESEFDRIKVGGGTHTNKLNLGDLTTLLLPLPPMAEQHRIVAKVDELMALCDQLEATQVERESRRNRLAVACLHQLNNGASAETLRERASFYLSQLPRVTTRMEHIQLLRQAILDLAARGNLVEQDRSDEPAAELLKRIQAEKESLIAKGTIPRQKLEMRHDAIELAFPRPQNWEAVTLGSICNLVTSGSRGWAEYYAKSGPKFIRAQNIRFGKVRPDDLACVSLPKKTEGTRTQVSTGDLLIVITGAGVTNPALLEQELGEAYVSQHVALIKPTDRNLSRWLLLCLMAPSGGRTELVERAYGAGKPGLNLDNIRSLLIPLPGLAEQRRIVAKVDELMVLCDKLQAQLATAQSENRRLLDAVLHGALNDSVAGDDRRTASTG